MQSKKSYFDKAIFRNNISRFWLLGIFHLIIWVLGMPVMVSNMARYTEFGGSVDIYKYILGFGAYGAPAMAFGFAIWSVMALFSYQSTTKSVSMYHSLPVTRANLFITNYLSGISLILLPAALVSALTWLVAAVNGIGGAAIYIVQCFGIYALSFVFFFGFACLCAQLTGNTMATAMLYVFLNFVVAIFEFCIRAIMGMFIYGIRMGGLTFEKLIPMAYLYYGRIKTVNTLPAYSGWKYLLVIAVVGCLMTAAAWFLYQRRHSESAGDIIAVRRLRPFFKYLFASVITLLLGLAFYGIIFSSLFRNQNNLAAFTVCMLGGAFIGYFVTEMALRKTLKVFKTAWKGFAVFAALVIVMMGIIGFDVLGAEKWVPAAAELESIELTVNGESLALSANDPLVARVLEIHQKIVASKSENEGVLEAYYEYSGTSGYDGRYYELNSSFSLYITYKKTNGGVSERYYTLPVQFDPNTGMATNEIPAMIEELYSQPSAVKARTRILWESDVSVTSIEVVEVSVYSSTYVDNEDFAGLMEAAKADIQQGNMLTYNVLGNGKYEELGAYRVYISGYETVGGRDSYIYANLEVNEDCVNVLRFLESGGYLTEIETIFPETVEPA